MFATKNPLLTPNIYAYIYTTSLDFGQHKLIYKDTKFSYFWKYAHILEAKMGIVILGEPSIVPGHARD
jgi:hypothetical protein